MRLKLQEKYIPIDYEDMLFEKLLFFRQGNSTVDVYNKFHELSLRSWVSEIKRLTIARYKAGLSGEIKKELLTIRLVSIEEVYRLALCVEQRGDFFDHTAPEQQLAYNDAFDGTN